MRKALFAIILALFLIAAPITHAFTVGSPSAQTTPSFEAYAPDPAAADQGATDTTAVTIKNLVDSIGTGLEATMIFHHSGAGNTTIYTLSTDETIPSNIKLYFEQGARIAPAAGVTLTVYSPEHILASPRQQIVDTTNNAVNPLVFTAPEGKAYSKWFNNVLEAWQESDAGHFILSEDVTISTTVDFDQDNSVIEFIAGVKLSLSSNTNDAITISGNNCKIIRPYIQGPGTYVVDESTVVGLLRITGSDCEVESPWLVNPPTHGIHATSAHRLKVHHGTFTSTFNSYDTVDTTHMAIRSYNGDEVDIHNNYIGSGFIEGIKISGGVDSRNPSIHHNKIVDVWDHAIYGGGDHENFSYNEIYHSATDAGSAIVGDSAYGIYNGNTIYSINGGIVIRDANDCVISGNRIEINATVNSPQGVVVQTHNTPGDMERCTVSSNEINFTGSSGSNGISLTTDTGSEKLNNNKVIGNTVINPCLDAGNAGIYLYSYGEGQDNEVSSNSVYNSGADGIEITYIKNSVISKNTIIDADFRAFDLTDINRNIFSNNIIIDETGSVTSTVFKETNSSTTCANNRYIDNEINCNGLGSANFYDLVGNDFTARILPDGKIWTLTGATNFYVGDGFVHIVDPGGGNRNFNPANDWPTPCIVTVINTADAAETITFDQPTLNQGVAQNERGIFGFDGTVWYKIYVGS